MFVQTQQHLQLKFKTLHQIPQPRLHKSNRHNTIVKFNTVYYLQETESGKFEIYFGDGATSKKVEDGNIVQLSYVITNKTAMVHHLLVHQVQLMVYKYHSYNSFKCNWWWRTRNYFLYKIKRTS